MKARADRTLPTGEPAQRVILAGIDAGRRDGAFAVDMDELETLVRAAGGVVINRVIQHKQKPDPKYLLGSGKVEELAAAATTAAANLVITLNALRPRQRIALEEELGDEVAVLDRSVIILEIFARHARSSEGKLQVELAQLRHRAANLIGSRDELSRLGGGIGTRGPGETKLEVDRRRLRLRIAHLERQLAAVRKRRREQRLSRAGMPVIALVGYTNAGKSSLLNTLTGAHIYVADQPFATLDPTLRRVQLDDGREAILADTVGFISDLPRELLAAFRATLEEVTSATALLHVVDAGNPFWERQRASVEAILADLNSADKPAVIAWNKADLLPPQQLTRRDLGVLVSAKTGYGLADLRAALAELIAPVRPDVAHAGA